MPLPIRRPRCCICPTKGDPSANDVAGWIGGPSRSGLDDVLDDIERSLDEWNDFLKGLKDRLKTYEPRNVFERIQVSTLHKERDWA